MKISLENYVIPSAGVYCVSTGSFVCQSGGTEPGAGENEKVIEEDFNL